MCCVSLAGRRWFQHLLADSSAVLMTVCGTGPKGHPQTRQTLKELKDLEKLL